MIKSIGNRTPGKSLCRFRPFLYRAAGTGTQKARCGQTAHTGLLFSLPVVQAAGGLLSVLQQSLHGQADALLVEVHIQQLHVDLIANLQHVADLLHALVADLADVD